MFWINSGVKFDRKCFASPPGRLFVPISSQCIIAINHTHTQFQTIIFSWFDLTTSDSYFTIPHEVFTNHILVANTYFTNRMELKEHKIMVLKPGNKYQIMLQFHNFKNILIDDFQHHPFLYRAKVL